jgi:SPP1 gp7 family putative phage head morphogenesis protein
MGSRAIVSLARRVTKSGVAKAIDPLSRQGFTRIVSSLRDDMRGIALEAEARVLQDAINALDVDWPSLSDQGRERVFDAARVVISDIPARVMPRVSERLEVVGRTTMEDSRSSMVRRYDLAIGTEITDRDTRAIDHVRGSIGNFVSSGYGGRASMFDRDARDVVARGLEKGLGAEEIALDLADSLSIVSQPLSYWSTVSMQYVNTARTYSQLIGFEEAGIEEYAFEAVIDEATTDICRFYHGKTFSVSAARAHMDSELELEEPEAIKDLSPWMREARDEAGNRIIVYRQGGRTNQVARVTRSGFGRSDDVGDFDGAMSDAALAKAGLLRPPLHANCRTTIIPAGYSS